MITKERKQELIKQFALSGQDTGSAAVQIAVLTERIDQVSKHLQTFRKDKHSLAGLQSMIGKKRRLAAYLKANNRESYEAVISKLKNR